MPDGRVSTTAEWVAAAARSVPPFSTLLVACWGWGQWQRDRSWVEGLLFCIPSPIVVLLLLAAALFTLQKPRSARRFVWRLALLSGPLFMLVCVETRWTRPPIAADSGSAFRLVHWNVGHGHSGWRAQRARLLSTDADVILVSEPPANVGPEDFPGYQCLRVDQLLLAVRGRVSWSGPLVPGGALHARLAHCELPGATLRILAADMTSNLRVPRDPHLRRLMTVARLRSADLVVGDLNAPRRSRALTAPDSEFRHAYDACGRGWGATWPVPAPVAAIDQCLFGPRVAPLRYELVSTAASDHRLQRFDFQLASGRHSGDNSPLLTSK